MEQQQKDRDAWVAAAIAAMRSGGVYSIRVEAIARDMRVTKGSFYWHFADRSDLLDEVLAAWEEETRWLIAEALAAPTPRERMLRYFSLIPESRKSYPPDVEVLAWARRDKRIAKRVRETEEVRHAFFETQLRDAGLRNAEATRRAQVAFLATQGWIEQTARGVHGIEELQKFVGYLFDLMLTPTKKVKA